MAQSTFPKPSTYFETTFFGHKVPSLRRIVGKNIATIGMKKNLTVKDWIIPLDMQYAQAIVPHLKKHWLSDYLELKVNNHMFKMEQLMERRDFLLLYQQVHKESCDTFGPSNLNHRMNFTRMLQSYESEVCQTYEQTPDVIYQRGMGSSMVLMRDPLSEENIQNFFMCQSNCKQFFNINTKKAPRVSHKIQNYYVEIPVSEYRMRWTKCEDPKPLLNVFQSPDPTYLNSPLEKNHEDFKKSMDMTSQRLVWAHRLLENDRHSEALTMIASSWIPTEMCQKVTFLSLLIEVSAELHVKQELQCKVIHMACKYISSISEEYTKHALVPSIMRAMLRWGYFSFQFHFYNANKDVCKYSVYEMKATMLAADGQIEEIENYLLFIIVYRIYHKHCTIQNTPCVSKLDCFKQFQHIEKCLKTLEVIVSSMILQYNKSDVNYYKGMMFFLKVLLTKLKNKHDKCSTLRRLANIHFYMSRETGRYSFSRRLNECRILSFQLFDKQVPNIDVKNIKTEMGCDKHYYNVDLRTGQVLTKLLILSAVSEKVKTTRTLCKEVLKQYKVATNNRSYRIPLLKAALQAIVIHRRHFMINEETQPDDCDRSFDEEDSNDEFRRYCSLSISPSLCQISLYQERNLIPLLAPNTEYHQLKDKIKPSTLIVDPSDQKNADINFETFYLSDKTLIGRHMFYGLQQLPI